jgi:hypothetical protein
MSIPAAFDSGCFGESFKYLGGINFFKKFLNLIYIHFVFTVESYKWRGSWEPSSAGLKTSFSGQQCDPKYNSFEPKSHEKPVGKRAVSYAFTITASLDEELSFSWFSCIDNTMVGFPGLCGPQHCICFCSEAALSACGSSYALLCLLDSPNVELATTLHSTT